MTIHSYNKGCKTQRNIIHNLKLYFCFLLKGRLFEQKNSCLLYLFLKSLLRSKAFGSLDSLLFIVYLLADDWLSFIKSEVLIENLESYEITVLRHPQTLRLISRWMRNSFQMINLAIMLHQQLNLLSVRHSILWAFYLIKKSILKTLMDRIM